MDLVLLSSLFASSLFGFIDIIWKKLRLKGVNTSAVLAMFVFSIPLFALLLLLVTQQTEIIITNQYLLVLSIWTVMSLISNYGIIYLYKYRSLSELNSYSLALTAICGLMVDMFWYRTVLQSNIIFASIALFIGGLLLTKRKTKIRKDLSIKATTILLVIVAIFRTADYFFYKVGLGMQENILLHVGISQISLFILFFLFGMKEYRTSVSKNSISWKHIVIVSILIFVYNIGEGYVIDRLPLMAAMLAGVISICIYLLYDLKTKEVHMTSSTLTGIISCLGGIILLSL